MGIRYYDEAIYNKIKNWIKDPNLRLLSVEDTARLFSVEASLNDDKPLTLPLVAISRDPSVTIDVSTRRSLSADGLHVGSNETKSLQLNAIPISVNYQIDIYTARYYQGDEYLRNFIFNLINYPRLKITLPYNGTNIEHVANIRLSNTVTDNSDISERLFVGQFTRWTLQFELQDAYLFSIPTSTNYKIDIDKTLDTASAVQLLEPEASVEIEEGSASSGHNGFIHIKEIES